MMLSAITVMNMLIGVLCQVVTVIGDKEEEKGQVRLLKRTVLQMLQELDEDGSNSIDRTEFHHVIDHPHAIEVLAELGVPLDHFLSLQDMIYEHEDRQLSIEEIIDMILACRGDKNATFKTVVDV